MDSYGSEFLSWSPVTIRQEIEEDFRVQLPPANFDRLMAGGYILTSDAFYKSLPDFNDLCQVLSGSLASPGVFEPATADDLAWGITEAMLLSPPDEGDDNPFTDEIISYIGYVLQSEGIINPPDILRIAGVDQVLRQRVQNDFADDPELASGIWKMEASKTEDIDNIVKARLQHLFQQLRSLPLANGNVSNIVERMSLNLARHRAAVI